MVAGRLILILLVSGWLAESSAPFAYAQTKPLARTDSLQIEAWYARWLVHRDHSSDSSRVYAQRIYDWGVTHRQPLVEARGLTYLSVEIRDKSDFTTSAALFQRALPLFERANYKEGIAAVNVGLALTYKRMADAKKITAFSQQALHYAKQGLALNQQLGNVGTIANAYNIVGIIQRDLKAFEEARQAYRAGLELLERAKINNITLATLYGNLAQLSIIPDQQYDQAIIYLNKALALNREANRKANIEHNLRNLCEAYRQKKQYEQAIKYVEEALQFSYKLNDPHRLFNTLASAYKAHRDAGNFQQALRYLEQGKTIEDSLGRADNVQQITRLQAEFDNKRAHDLATIEAEKEEQIAGIRARLALQNAHSLALVAADKDRDLLRIQTQADIAKARSVAEIRARLTTRQKEADIRQLQDKNQLQQRQLAGLALSVGLFVLLSGLLSWQYRRIRQNRTQIQHQAEQLRMLMRELHHRVKNNLAIVSGLLELQSNRLADESAKRAFREGQQRVQAMSILHQRLYQTEAVTTIDMGDYVTSLIESLMGAYGYTSETLQVDVSVEKQEIDVDLAIPFGLILNELLTNAFKYALPTTSKPRLSVGLHHQSDGITLRVADNGPGLDMASWHRPGGSFGKRLIAALSDQIGGIISVENHNGTQFLIRIPANEPTVTRAVARAA